MALFKEILSHLLPNTLVCIGCDLTLSTEYIKTLTVQQWKKERPQLDKRPCIFILEAGF